MNLLYPRLTLRQFGAMFLFGLVGALIGGAYGIVHDLVTFRIGPEYFTKFKFIQFSYLDMSQPETATVAKIGFLATWWVGFFSAWFMGRMTLPHEPVQQAIRRSLRGVLMVMGGALLFAMAGFALAPASAHGQSLGYWQGMLDAYGIEDRAGFIRAGYIHNGSYLGGFTGLVAALVWLKRTRKAVPGACEAGAGVRTR